MILNFDANVMSIFRALQAKGDKCYIVGGAVRDLLIGLEVSDFDFSVPYAPQKTDDLLKKAGIATVPTGIKHGTISAIIDKKAYEITSMRKDVATDGRFAIVEYCDDINQDAARRDFTFNALYADEKGEIYDPTGQGLGDLKNRKLKFVGDPKLRIYEDYLRILRLYRFYSQLENIEIDSASEKAAAELAPKIANLSSERVWAEIKKTLAGVQVISAVEKLTNCGIWESLFKSQPQFAVLRKFLKCERRIDVLGRLLALIPIESDLKFCRDLRMANSEIARFEDRKKAHAISEKSPKIIAYKFSNETAIDLEFARRNEIECNEIDEIRNFVPPNFPIKANDILQKGFKPGPKIGQILNEIETQWLKNDFAITQSEVASIISRFDAAN